MNTNGPCYLILLEYTYCYLQSCIITVSYIDQPFPDHVSFWDCLLANTVYRGIFKSGHRLWVPLFGGLQLETDFYSDKTKLIQWSYTWCQTLPCDNSASCCPVQITLNINNPCQQTWKVFSCFTVHMFLVFPPASLKTQSGAGELSEPMQNKVT